jgi:hypothetical protein
MSVISATAEIEAGDLQVQVQPEQQNEMHLKKKNKRIVNFISSLLFLS